MNIQSPRGTRDILPADQPAWKFVRHAAGKVATQLNYQRIDTPTYEERGLFERSIGEGTDVMDKELFLVRGVASDEEKYALRPEGTAGIVRSFIEHGMHTWPQPVKLWSLVNNFRYDRPQKGRYREHVQFDIEIFGDQSPWADAWVILTTWQFLKEVGLGEKVLLKINTLGTSEERQEYMRVLVDYLQPRAGELSLDSQHRLEKNPLRILDSKDQADQYVVQQGPKITDVLSDMSRAHYEEVKRLLGVWGIPFAEDAGLVRGLDYYSHTTFEWVPTGGDGQQSSIGGGGRYDGLLPQLGGPNVGAVGAGLGLDRIVEMLGEMEALEGPEYFLVAADAAGREKLEREILPRLLDEGKTVDAILNKEGVGGQLKQASRVGAKKAIILGQQEIEKGEMVVKDLVSGEQHTSQF